MKIFIYKLFISLAAVYVLFQLTFGLIIKEVKKDIFELTSKENALTIKEKIREEMKAGIKKERLLEIEDAKLLRLYLEKIKDEINKSK